MMRPPVVPVVPGSTVHGIRVPANIAEPVVMVTTASLGPKLDAGISLGKLLSIGTDLVAVVADDLAAKGARPVAVSCFARDDLATVVAESVVEACRVAGCAYLGAQIVAHEVKGPILIGTAVGFAAAKSSPRVEEIRAGDAIIGLLSDDLRTSGFEMISALLADHPDLAEDMMRPSTIFTPAVMAALEIGAVHGMVNISRWGLTRGLATALPPGLSARLDAHAWTVPEVFSELQGRLGLTGAQMLDTFTQGIGFLLIVAAEYAPPLLAVIDEYDRSAVVIGEIVAGNGSVAMTSHAP
jgi:phosphoribosylformylglycinamidine cyclo-ligase